jgi:hypothetical protein
VASVSSFLAVAADDFEMLVSSNLFKWYRGRNNIFNTSYNTGKLILLFFLAILVSYWENLVALGSEPQSSKQQPGTGSCVVIYNWRTVLRFNLL